MSLRTGHPAPIALTPWSDPDPMDVFRSHARTFWAASLLLPPAVRRELGVLYAFCRLVDDCGDEQTDASRAHAWLNRIERDVERGESDLPLVARFLDLAEERSVALPLAIQLIEGVRSDLGPVRIASEARLVRYCYRVASTVGLMMCRVLRVAREGHEYAVDLGVAMQLTNIARDVAADAARDRVYLPGEWVRPDDVLDAALRGDAQAGARVMPCVDRLLRLARTYYRSADRGMRHLPVGVRPGIRAASANYEAIGGVIRSDPARFLTARARTTGAAKALRSVGAGARACADSLPARRMPPHDDRLHAHLRPLLTLS